MVWPTLTPLWVESPKEILELCELSRQRQSMAFDSEADSFHRYFHKLCLLQLTVGEVHAVIDPLAFSREDLHPLLEVLADSRVRKVMHGADYDIRMLQKDLGARVRALADTQLAAQFLGEPATGLAALVAKELGVPLVKEFQRANWAERPLSPELLQYAVADTAFLEDLCERLLVRLEDLGRRGWWEEECRALEEVEYRPPEPDPLAFLRLKGAQQLDERGRRRLYGLWLWREECAQEADVPPFRWLSNQAMVLLAQKPPSSLKELGLVPGLSRGLVRRWGRKMLEILREPPQAPAVPARVSAAPPPQWEAQVRRLRQLRDEVAQELGLAPGLLAPRSCLEKILEEKPATPEAWYRCLGRRWRVDLLSQRFAEALKQN